MKIRDVDKIIEVDETFQPQWKVLILDKFYIVETIVKCPHCHKANKIIGFAYDKHYDFYYERIKSDGIIINPVPELSQKLSPFLHTFNCKTVNTLFVNNVLENFCLRCKNNFETEKIFGDSGAFDLQKNGEPKIILHEFQLKYPLLYNPRNEGLYQNIYENSTIVKHFEI